MKQMSIIALSAAVWFALAMHGESGGDKENGTTLQPLWPNGAPGAKGTESADIPGIYLHLAPKPNGAAIVVCPGGGYGVHAMDHEGKQIAAWLNGHGITAIILKYRLGPKYNHPVELGDAQRALRYARANAEKWKVDPKRVGILGFSAGGHLASTAGTHFDHGLKDPKDPIDEQSCRPDFMVLVYPVITLSGPYAHLGSRNNLLGKIPDPKLIELLSNEKQVTKDTPPTFLVHTSEDTGVPPENSLLFYQALSKNKVPAEMHIYEKGRHGLGLGQKDSAFASWPDRCIAWLKGRGMLEEPRTK
jgi:acetyl esterase/lipase